MLRAIAAAAAEPLALGLEPAPGPRWDARLALWDRALAPAADCVDPRYLGATIEPPERLDLSEITWLEGHLQTGAALALAGDPATATARLQRVRSRADASGDRWRRARADLALGIASFKRGDEASAALSREHNDANVLALGARVTSPELAIRLLDLFLDTPFAGGRHQRRIDKIAALDQVPR